MPFPFDNQSIPMMAPFGVGTEQSPMQSGVSQAMLTLANMPDSGDRPAGAGEAISNVARGIAGGQMQRMQLNMMRYMLPMQIALQQAQLRKMTAPQPIPTKYGIAMYNPFAQQGQPMLSAGMSARQLAFPSSNGQTPMNDPSESLYKLAETEQDPDIKAIYQTGGDIAKGMPDPEQAATMANSTMERAASLRQTKTQNRMMDQILAQRNQVMQYGYSLRDPALQFRPYVDPQTMQVRYGRVGELAASGAMAPNSAVYQGLTSMQRAFTSGPQGQLLANFRTAQQHAQLLVQMGMALNNGNIQAINYLGNLYARETGNPAPTNFDMVKQALAGEVAKVFKGQATEGEISNIAAQINNAESPQQLTGVVQQSIMPLMVSKGNALLEQYQMGLQGMPDFNGLSEGGPGFPGVPPQGGFPGGFNPTPGLPIMPMGGGGKVKKGANGVSSNATHVWTPGGLQQTE